LLILGNTGLAKEFEVVDSVPRVIALEDEDYDSESDYWEDDGGWDIVVRERKSYSAVLSGNRG
jgi:hypothetical protein